MGAQSLLYCFNASLINTLLTTTHHLPPTSRRILGQTGKIITFLFEFCNLFAIHSSP